ncbi:uncharacterized protein LOC102080407 [Oreochromis niloticus]|uniref:uncharacterized protein LOC102080407 n=1 Tax=Oreochromis niloticus TaxID=8128 RepID=UPI000DF380F7|nr:uncharacterized protein LOC102080407 [Oreochromis niloticus]
MSNKFWGESKKLFGGNKKPDLSYATLVLDTDESVSPSKIKKVKKKKSKLSRPKKLRKYIPEEKPDISPSELLETDKNILLVGKPGIGKTALTHEMLRLWAERESKELDYMFYFDMRETSDIIRAKNLEELLFGVFCEPDEGKDEVLQDIKRHSDNVIIIFDGITNLSSQVVKKVLTKKLLPLAKIIITCRPDDEDEDFLSGDFDRVEVKGFMQEFFAALWILKNPDKIRDVFQQCLTEEKKQMKHLIPFMCRLLNEKSPSLMKHLIPDQDLKNTSNWFFKELINTFLLHLCEQEEADTEDSGLHVDILFLCQCLYESQSPEACIYFLNKLKYRLDLSGVSVDPYPCCAVAYVVTQSEKKKICLNLEDVVISEQGMRQLFECFKNVQWSGPLPRQLWEIFLINEEQMNFVSLLSLDGNLHLLVDGEKKLFERAAEVMQRMHTKVNVCLHWDKETPACHSQCESLLKALPFISSLSFRGPVSWRQEKYHGTLEREQKRLFMDLCLKAALHDKEKNKDILKRLLLLFPVKTDIDNIFLDLFEHVKEFSSDFKMALKPFFQSAPAVWSINLSERKTSILLEVLKLQPEKKQVELTGCSHEERGAKEK